MRCPNCGTELWGASDVLRAFGVARKTLKDWRDNRGFPKPVGKVGGRPCWEAEKVRKWREGTTRGR